MLPPGGRLAVEAPGLRQNQPAKRKASALTLTIDCSNTYTRTIIHNQPHCFNKEHQTTITSTALQPSMLLRTSCFSHRDYKSNKHKTNIIFIAAEATSLRCLSNERTSSCVSTPIHRYSPTQSCRNPARSSRLLRSTTQNGLLPGRSTQYL